MVPSFRTWNTTKSHSYLQCVRSHLLRVTDFHVYEMNCYSPRECMHARICLSAYAFCLPILFLQQAMVYTKVFSRMYGFYLGNKPSCNAKAPKTSLFVFKRGEQARPPHVCYMLSYKNPTKDCYCLRFLLLLTSGSEMRGFCSDSCGSWQQNKPMSNSRKKSSFTSAHLSGMLQPSSGAAQAARSSISASCSSLSFLLEHPISTWVFRKQN